MSHLPLSKDYRRNSQVFEKSTKAALAMFLLHLELNPLLLETTSENLKLTSVDTSSHFQKKRIASQIKN
jgi:hypothetical protein